MNDNFKDETAKPIRIHMKLHTVKWKQRIDGKGEELWRGAYPRVDAARENPGAPLRGTGVQGHRAETVLLSVSLPHSSAVDA